MKIKNKKTGIKAELGTQLHSIAKPAIETANYIEKDINKHKYHPNFNLGEISLTPLSGNIYLQRGMDYLNQGLNKIPGIVDYTKTGKISKDNMQPFTYNQFIKPNTSYKNVNPTYVNGQLTYMKNGGGGFEEYGLAQPNPYVSSQSYIEQQKMPPNKPDLMELNRPNLLQAPELSGQKISQPINNKWNANSLATLAPIADTTLAGINFGKGTIDMIGSNLQNRFVQQREADMYTQSVFSDAMNVTPYETMGYGFTGRNALAADGMQIRQIGGMGEPNVEVEGKEHIKLPNGFSQEIQGKSHAQGGIPLNLPQGTQIFSEKLKPQVKFLKELMEIDPQYSFLSKAKLPEKGVISYADLAKKFETKKYVDLLNSKTADPIQKTTAEMMMSQSLMALEKLFALQEQNKLSGVHGPQVQQNAMEAKQQEQEQAQEQQQSMKQEPMMRHGGYHLPKAQEANMPFVPSGGVDVKSYSPKTRSGRHTGETDLDIMKGKSWKDRNLTEWDQAYAQDYGMPGFNIAELAQDPNVAKKYSSLPGKDPIAGLYQEYMYDYHLDRLDPNQNFSPEEREKSRQALQNMWQPSGSTRYGLSKNIKAKGIDFNKAGYEDYANLRGSFIDAIGQYRYLQPNERPAPAQTTPAAPAGKAPEEKAPEIPVSEQPNKLPPNIVYKDKPINKYVQPNIDFDLNLGIPLPNIYGREPLNYYKVEPQYIDPRYLDIQPELNTLTRGQRTFQNNLGSRSTTDIANLLQSQANTDMGKNQVYGQKYNYDRGQDAHTQQFNAQAKMNTDQYNQNSWFGQLEDPIRRREGAISTQQLMDNQSAIENDRKLKAFNNNKGYIEDTFYPYKDLTSDEIANYLSIINKPTENKYSKNKNGGKIKLKLKK